MRRSCCGALAKDLPPSRKVCGPGKHSVLFCWLSKPSGHYLDALSEHSLRSGYSYGRNLYGHPIAQAIVFDTLPRSILKRNTRTTIVLIITSSVLTQLFSPISWRLVESRVLELKKVFLGRRSWLARSEASVL